MIPPVPGSDFSRGKRRSPGEAWQAPAPSELSEFFPQYEVLELVGRGGMGAVFKARQKSLKRLVAIKILPLGLADDEFKFVERFQNEAQMMAKLNHPAIVSVYDFGETADGLLYFVMEFIEGTDVQKMIQSRGRLSSHHALVITAQVCDALHYAHSRGVVHRDIKPANILIDPEGRIKVADFGLAKIQDPAQTSALTRTNMAMGTPDYVAPEVLVPGMVADHRADLYAVGVMLYQMITGEVPRGMFKLPSEKVAGSDERLDFVICKAMEQDRSERYQSALDVRTALEEILATPHVPVAGPAALVVRGKLSPVPVTVELPVSRRLRTKWMAALAISAVVVVAALIVLLPDRATPKTVPGPAPAGLPAEKWVDWIASRQWSGAWTVKDGVLRTSALITIMPFGGITDGAVRVRFRSNPDAVNKGQVPLQLVFRSTIDSQAVATRGEYCFQFDPDTRLCSLIFVSKQQPGGQALPTEVLWAGKAIPMENGEADVECRVEGEVLSLRSGGRLIASVGDDRLHSGWCSIIASPSVLITKLHATGIMLKPDLEPFAKSKRSGAAWQDVTSVMLRDLKQLGCVAEGDGVTTDKVILGTEVLPPATRDAAVRVTYLLRGAESGVMISAREQKGGKEWEHYLAEDDGMLLSIAQAQADMPRYKRLASQPITASITAQAERTLEFRLVGDQLTATLNGTVVATAKDAAYPQGMYAIVLKKGALVKKVETWTPGGVRSGGSGP